MSRGYPLYTPFSASMAPPEVALSKYVVSCDRLVDCWVVAVRFVQIHVTTHILHLIKVTTNT